MINSKAYIFIFDIKEFSNIIITDLEVVYFMSFYSIRH